MNPKPAIAKPSSRSARDIAQKLESWLLRAESDFTPNEFLEQFDAYNLPIWDHYARVRAIFLILEKYGRQQGKDKIFEGLASNERARSQTFHLSMTYFWIQIVHFGMRNTPSIPTDGSAKANDVDAFPRFLLVNPHVVDDMLWEDFYSKDVLMSPGAWKAMVLPDKKPLPSVSIRDMIKGLGNA